MKVVNFDVKLENGALGRSGYITTTGIVVGGGMHGDVWFQPVNSKGDQARAQIDIPASSAGEFVRAVSELAVKSRPELKESMLEELRAAILAIECGSELGIEDEISSFVPPLG